VNRRIIEQALRAQQGLADLRSTWTSMEGEAARRRVHQGGRDWSSLKLAVDSESEAPANLRALMRGLPEAVVRRADGEQAVVPTDVLVELLAHVPSETIGTRAKQLKQDARAAAQDEPEALLAMAYTWVWLVLKRDPGLRRLRKQCWRRSGAGWRLTSVVERLAGDGSATHAERDALRQLNDPDLITNDGYHLGPAVVMEGGELVREIDTTRPRVDMDARRREWDARLREDAEALERTRRKRRSNMVRNGHDILPDSDQVPSDGQGNGGNAAGQEPCI
jgi:hypothetical protein